MPRPHKFDPPLRREEFQTTTMGQALLAGRLVATAVSDQDGRHITVRFSCKAPPEGRGRWQLVPFDAARKVYVDVPSADLSQGDSVGDYNRATSTLWAVNDDQRRVNAARYILLVAAGRLDGRKVLMSTNCLRCGRALTDPVSIERSVGPECYGKITGSQHERKGEDDFVTGQARAQISAYEQAAELSAAGYTSDDLPTDEDADAMFLTLNPGDDPRSLRRKGA